MQEDKEKWNKRYLQMQMPLESSDIIRESTMLLPHSGRALDIACGNGRNARFLASCGLDVRAIDISDIAINLANKLYRESNNHQTKGSLELLCLDLDSYHIEPKSYDVICNFYFLNRDILYQIPSALKPNGLVFLETFEENKDYPTNIDSAKTLYQDELLEVFKDCQIILNQTKIITRDRIDQQACVRQFIARNQI